MSTETLDKLYLEWSQFTKARTSREIAMRKALQWIVVHSLGADPNRIRAIARDASRCCGNIARAVMFCY